ncbi:MAG: YeeE/YedE family protein [Armatimonadetes bacterium]|nr:YeeE/YedE family protein [Armatimonadota bacterium]
MFLWKVKWKDLQLYRRAVYFYCRKLVGNQWSFVIGGLLIGLSEALYYIKYDHPIHLTTGLAEMFASMERLLGFSLLSRYYSPSVHWVIVGAVLAAVITAMMEQDWRAWVHYPRSILWLSFAGGMVFSFGSRLASGCTTWHFLGGLATMWTGSLVVVFVGIPTAMATLWILSRMRLSEFLKPQENKGTVVAARMLGYAHDFSGLDEGYKPARDRIRIILIIFASLILGGSVIASWTSTARSAAEILFLVLVGLLLGLGFAKTGMGTECAAMSPETRILRDRFELAGIPKITKWTFSSIMPFAGLLSAVIPLHLVILWQWIVRGHPLPLAGSPDLPGIHLGYVLGGVLLAIGSMLMLGCEIRTYARLGMGYTTALAAFPGFYLGYVPYALYHQRIDAFLTSIAIPLPQNLPALAGGFPMGQTAIAVLYACALVALFLWSVRVGTSTLGCSYGEYFFTSTDNLYVRSEQRSQGGQWPTT